MEYIPTIGLEIHAELNTKSKMFCSCKNDPDEKKPNVNVCPVCLGHPGTLPVPNGEAIKSVIKVGLAIGGEIASISKFDRKNYFYPDLPKGYQISQFDKPIVSGGNLNGVRITRIHLEEDAGRLAHGEGATLVDFNRAGVPLMELVTEPDIKTAEEAASFAKELQLLLRYVDVSEANMEKGEMRVEANVSIRAKNFPGAPLGMKVEVKNINSFRAVYDAIEYELKRQSEVLNKNEKVKQETRGWDDVEKITVSQRSKEEAHDYRYFPEPDIPPFETKEFDVEKLRKKLPELPVARRERFGREFGISDAQAALLVIQKELADFYEAAESELATRDDRESSKIEKHPRDLLFNYLMSDLTGLMNEHDVGFDVLKITPEHLAHLVDLIADGKIMSRGAKDILRKMFETGNDPEDILRDEGLHAISDEKQLAKVVKEVISEHAPAVVDYHKGKVASLQFLVGKAMGKLKGKGDPGGLRNMFERMLAEKK